MAVETARIQVARLLNAASENIVFTGSGTEADNLAILGMTQQYRLQQDREPQHLIISSVEHSAVEKPAQHLEQQGWSVTRLPVNALGQVSVEALRQAICPNTRLISVIHSQSEVGTLQPIAALGQVAQAAGIPFHCDAVQSAGRVALDVQALPVDLLSISSHKIYGPQGVGALYISPALANTFQPQIRGGSQEHGLRAGTQAVGAIAAFGTAAELAARELVTEPPRLKQLQTQLIQGLQSIPSLQFTGHPTERLPHHISFCLSDDLAALGGRKLVYAMAKQGIAISAGSACNSGQSQPSTVLKAMGYSDAQALSASRLTLGKPTTETDIEQAAAVLQRLLTQGSAVGKAIAVY